MDALDMTGSGSGSTDAYQAAPTGSDRAHVYSADSFPWHSDLWLCGLMAGTLITVTGDT